MAVTIASRYGIAAQSEPTSKQPYFFFAVAEGMRIPLKVNAICDSDAEASLVALSLCTSLIGVEAYQSGVLVYHAPRRVQGSAVSLQADTATAGQA